MEFEIKNGSEKKREPKGLVDGGNVEITCANCGKPLMTFQLTQLQNNVVLTRVMVKCGFCGGHSNVEQIVGQFYPGAVSDSIVFDISENDTEVECDVCFKAWSK